MTSLNNIIPIKVNTPLQAHYITVTMNALTIPGRVISMTRNSGLPSGGSLIILYLGAAHFDLEMTSSIFGEFDETVSKRCNKN